MANDRINRELQDLALMLAVNCVRNTVIEYYHGGKYPESVVGDYSDVKVITPKGEIPWNELSRISDKEMKTFNIEVVNKIYTFLQMLLNPEISPNDKEAYMKMISLFYPDHWNKPELDKDILKGIKISQNEK